MPKSSAQGGGRHRSGSFFAGSDGGVPASEVGSMSSGTVLYPPAGGGGGGGADNASLSSSSSTVAPSLSTSRVRRKVFICRMPQVGGAAGTGASLLSTFASSAAGHFSEFSLHPSTPTQSASPYRGHRRFCTVLYGGSGDAAATPRLEISSPRSPAAAPAAGRDRSPLIAPSAAATPASPASPSFEEPPTAAADPSPVAGPSKESPFPFKRPHLPPSKRYSSMSPAKGASRTSSKAEAAAASGGGANSSSEDTDGSHVGDGSFKKPRGRPKKRQSSPRKADPPRSPPAKAGKTRSPSKKGKEPLSPASAAQTEEMQELFGRARYLKNWVPRLHGSDGKKFIVEGDLIDFGRSAAEPGACFPDRWKTSKIKGRKLANLITTSGSPYVLEGRLNYRLAVREGMPQFIIQAFANGFPENWEVYRDQWRFLKRDQAANCSSASVVSSVGDASAFVADASRTWRRRSPAASSSAMPPPPPPEPVAGPSRESGPHPSSEEEAEEETAVVEEEVVKPKKRRGRPPLNKKEPKVLLQKLPEEGAKRRPGRPRKKEAAPAEEEPEAAGTEMGRTRLSAEPPARATRSKSPKKSASRSKSPQKTAANPEVAEEEDEEDQPLSRSRRGRRTTTRKPMVLEDDEDDDFEPVVKPHRGRRGKKAAATDDDDEDFLPLGQPVKGRRGRRPKETSAAGSPPPPPQPSRPPRKQVAAASAGRRPGRPPKDSKPDPVPKAAAPKGPGRGSRGGGSSSTFGPGRRRTAATERKVEEVAHVSQLVANPKTVRDRARNTDILRRLNAGHEDDLFQELSASKSKDKKASTTAGPPRPSLPPADPEASFDKRKKGGGGADDLLELFSDTSDNDYSMHSARTPITSYMKVGRRGSDDGEDEDPKDEEDVVEREARKELPKVKENFIHNKLKESRRMHRLFPAKNHDPRVLTPPSASSGRRPTPKNGGGRKKSAVLDDRTARDLRYVEEARRRAGDGDDGREEYAEDYFEEEEEEEDEEEAVAGDDASSLVDAPDAYRERLDRERRMWR